VKEFGLDMRIGVHTGEVEYEEESLIGITVHIGFRVANLAGVGEVLVSSTVRDLMAGSGITFTDRGTHILRGIPGEWRLFMPDIPTARAPTS
jgi:class 3 adenylate cyclase